MKIPRNLLLRDAWRLLTRLLRKTDLMLQFLNAVVEGKDGWNNSTDCDDLLPLCQISCFSKWLQDIHQALQQIPLPRCE